MYLYYVFPESKEDDIFNLHRDISDMMHDVSVLGQISTLTNSLKLSYEVYLCMYLLLKNNLPTFRGISVWLIFTVAQLLKIW